jgi:hypothetical protein
MPLNGTLFLFRPASFITFGGKPVRLPSGIPFSLVYQYPVPWI